MSKSIKFSELEEVSEIESGHHIHVFKADDGNYKMKASSLLLGNTISISADGNWVIDGVDTGMSSKGDSVSIGSNGNWYIGSNDTGISASQKMHTVDYNHQIDGSRNGTNNTLVASNSYVAGTMNVYKSGMRLSKGGTYDYVESSDINGELNSVTFTIPPSPNENIIFEYIKV